MQDSKKKLLHRGRMEKKIEFASSDRVEDMRRIADEFMMEIFDFLPGEYLITDESSLRDFTDFGSSDTSEIWGRIKDGYSLEKSDVPSEILADIFSEIQARRNLQ